MKKNTLLLLLLCAPVTGPLKGGHQTSGDQAVSGIAFLSPQIDTDFSDLDVRDAQNNPTQKPSARQELETLFRENLFQLTVLAGPHAMSTTYDWLDTFTHLFNKTIYTRLLAIFDLFQDAYLATVRRFVHNVHNLCITFSVGVFAGCLLLSAFTLQRSPRTVYLRC